MANKKSVDDIVSVDGPEARYILACGCRYLDVRMNDVFEKGHIDGALNVPFYSSVTAEEKVKNPQFIEQVSSLFGKDDSFIVGCHTGGRSKLATVDLLNAGFTQVKNMRGGYVSWLATIKEEVEF